MIVLDLSCKGGSRQRIQEVLQSGEVLLRVASQVGCMFGLFPPLVVNAHSSPLPEVDQLLQDRWVAHRIVLREEEEGRGSDGASVEDLDAVLVEVGRVGLEKPEIKHGCVLYEAL